MSSFNRRQTEGGETWRRLRDWNRGQTPSERLAAHILRIEGYKAIDPSHPLGGQDGLKDIICVRNNLKYIGASYFPRSQQKFNVIINKFMDDFEGVTKNSVEGFAFVTNQELTLSERHALIEKASPTPVDLFHLERVSSILDSPQCYGIRLEFLDIEMTKEEQLAFMANVSQISDRLEEILTYISKSDILQEELNNLRVAQDKSKIPHYVIPVLVDHPLTLSIDEKQLKTCSQCGFGYLVKGEKSLLVSPIPISKYGLIVVICPKCGHTEYF